MKIMLGITTYNRPDYFKDCIQSVIEHLLPHVDGVFVYNDGSKKKDYQAIYDSLPDTVHIEHKNVNKGVAHAKNWLLKRMMREGADYMFMLEDDLIIKSPKAIFGYLKVAKETGIGHLMFAHHGPMNVDRCVWHDSNGIELYPHCVGAWCMYSREAIEKAGYMDEKFHNAWEHVEHTFRIAEAEQTVEFGYFADVKDSAEWIAEQPDSIENSSIRKTKDWAMGTVQGLIYWKNKNPKNFPLHDELKMLMKQAGIQEIIV